jgi:hypothetical protein
MEQEANKAASDFRSPDQPQNASTQKALRLTNRIYDKFSDIQSFYGFLGCAVGIFGIGFCEGMMPCKTKSFRFAARYVWENIFPSVTHATKDMRHIALAVGRKPDELLITNPANKQEANSLLRAEGFRVTRNILFGLVGVAGAVKVVDTENEAEQEYTQSVYNGREPLLMGTTERVI